MDLRTRVVGAVDEGDLVDEVAARDKVSGRTVWSWLALRAETGGVAPRTEAKPSRRWRTHNLSVDEVLKSSLQKRMRRARTLASAVTVVHFRPTA